MTDYDLKPLRRAHYLYVVLYEMDWFLYCGTYFQIYF